MVTIAEAAVRVKAEGQNTYEPKTNSSVRRVPLDAATAALLAHHRAEQNEHMLSVGDVYENNDFVFANPFGKMLDLDRTSQTFKRIARRAGHPKTRLHDLRHAHATVLFAVGEHPLIVSERLGHASPGFTLSTYGHTNVEMQERAAENYAKYMTDS